jgi:acyl carrier protein
VDVQLKRGHALNEMTRFRYDVVVHVGGAPAPVLPVAAEPAPRDLDAVRARLAGEPDAVWFSGFENRRLTGEFELSRLVAARGGDAQTLRAATSRVARGEDPEVLALLDDRYDVDLLWPTSGPLDRFDAVFRHRLRGVRGQVTPFTPVSAPVEQYANVPAKSTVVAGNASEWRTHLRSRLPEYMVPAAFVVLPELPLTPNGKVDRKALPAPDARATAVAKVEYVAPSSDIEVTIAQIWQDLLAVPRVGLKENIFDLGANSLLTVQANNKLSQALGRRVSLVSMFQFPTVESLATHLGQQQSKTAAPDAGAGKARAEARRQAMRQRGR